MKFNMSKWSSILSSTLILLFVSGVCFGQQMPSPSLPHVFIPMSVGITPLQTSVPLGINVRFVVHVPLICTRVATNWCPRGPWQSSDTSIATINRLGIAHATGVGTTTIRYGTYSATLTVTPIVMVSIKINPSQITMPVGLYRHFRATATYSDSSTRDVTDTVYWSSSADWIVETCGVYGNSCVMAVAPGTATVIANYGAMESRVSVQVVNRKSTNWYSDNVTYSTLYHFTPQPNTGELIQSGSTSLNGMWPHSMALAPSQKFLYILDPLSSSIAEFAIDPQSGATTLTGKIPAQGQLPVGLAIEPKGRFLYTANASSNNISGFTVNSITGVLTPMTGSPFSAGGMPMSLSVTPDGLFLYALNSSSGSVSSYSINQATGVLSHTKDYILNGQWPSTIAIDPTGRYLFTVNTGSQNVSEYAIGTAGVLTEVAGSPYEVQGGQSPMYIAFDPMGNFVYVSDPTSNTITLFTLSDRGDGKLYFMSSQIVAGNPSSMTMDPSGQYLYLTETYSGNDATGDIAKYAVNPVWGSLTFITKTMMNGWPDSLVMTYQDGN
jgi:6-phosphogluconolactonase